MKIIVIGCGRLGAGLAKNLELQGIEVAVIDSDPKAFASLGKSFRGKTFVGLGFDEAILRQAGIEQADALAAVTASDDTNVVIARLAKTAFKVPRVAARVYQPQKAKVYRRLGIQTISTVTLGVERLTSVLVYSHMAIERTIGAGQVVLVNEDVPAHLVGRAVHSVNIPGEIEVAALTRNGKTFLPNGATLYQPDDLVHLFVLAGAKDKVNKAFGIR